MRGCRGIGRRREKGGFGNGSWEGEGGDEKDTEGYLSGELGG